MFGGNLVPNVQLFFTDVMKNGQQIHHNESWGGKMAIKSRVRLITIYP